MSVPRYSFVRPWDHNGNCVVEVDGTTFSVKQIQGGGVWQIEFRAYHGEGPAIAKAGKFTTLLRKLDRWPAADA